MTTKTKLLPEVQKIVDEKACDCGGSKCWPRETTEALALAVQQAVAKRCAEIAREHLDMRTAGNIRSEFGEEQ